MGELFGFFVYQVYKIGRKVSKTGVVRQWDVSRIAGNTPGRPFMLNLIFGLIHGIGPRWV